MKEWFLQKKKKKKKKEKIESYIKEIEFIIKNSKDERKKEMEIIKEIKKICGNFR